MKTFLKISIITIISICLLMELYGVYNAIMGGYLRYNLFKGIMMIVALLASIVLFVFILRRIKHLWKIFFLLLIVTLQSCNYAKSNQQVLVSEDCGMNWKKVNAGDAVPKGGMNPCYMKVVVPNFPMQGDMKFLANLAKKVKVTTHIDYDYSITNGLAFINEAKYIGKANADADSEDALDPSAFEGAENRVIDKRIKEVAKRLFLNEDIVDMEQDELELRLETEVNKVLEKLGVRLNFLTLTFLPDDQTRQAIDISTAMRIYKSNDLEELGKQVMIARAGATQISVENKTSNKTSEE
ncbi:hypothetical protein [uncultured Flavobacterium sp.]|uniref:hypothetical protein n=1 Tax=uncultured Flavobacterium sp. TaxID=165435 RepID=UPI0025F62853|nr:hypothetical protein [uncultured Flavobacterium sp.]